jgi:hypothetical protein
MGARSGFDAARDKLRAAQAEAQRVATVFKTLSSPNMKAAEAEMKRVQNAVSLATKAYEAQKSAVLEHRRVIGCMGIDIQGAALHQERLRTRVQDTTRALHQQNQIIKAMAMGGADQPPRGRRIVGSVHGDHAHVGSTMSVIGETGAVYTAGRVAKHAFKEGSDFQHERVRMEASGMSPDEIEQAEKESARLSKKYLPVSQTQIMHMLRNARSVVGNYHEAAEIADPLLALRVVAMGAHPDKASELNEDFDKLVKGMEIKGVTQNHGMFNHYIDNMAKAINVFGDTLRPTDFYETFKYGRAATNALSDDFMLSTAPTLAQELGGSSAGKAVSSFHTQFVGGKMSNRSVEQLLKYGMLDPKNVIKTKTGNVKGVLPGGIVGQEYLKPGHEDPYAWVNKVLIPKLAAKGITDPAEVQEVISALASQQTSAQMMSIFAGQQPRIEKDKALIRGAKGIDAAPSFMRNDPKLGAKSITEQTNNILQNATGPAMEKAAPIMHSFAGSLAEIAEAAKDHPHLSTIAAGGALSGLIAGGAKGAGWLLPAIFGSLPEGGIVRAIGGTLGTAAKWGMRGSGWTTAALLAYQAYQARDEIGADLVGKGAHAITGDPWQQRYNLDHPTDTLDQLRRQRTNRPRLAGPGITPTMTYDGSGGIGEAPNWGKTSGSMSVEVHGDAALTLKIEAPELLRIVSRAEAVIKLGGSSNWNGPGSAGHSSPDASAASSGMAYGP